MLYNKCNKVSRREWIRGPMQQATRGRTSKHKERDSGLRNLKNPQRPSNSQQRPLPPPQVRRTPSGLMVDILAHMNIGFDIASPTRSHSPPGHTILSQASLTYTSPPRAGREFCSLPVEPAAHHITTEDNHPQDFKRRIRRA
ncbi:hypothetical protein NCU03640 [Neurospora crassa OR74A]|uniref:Uncharacterized protein n=2 Tax=Neurospora crassa TaxID=5141 RepID=Q1K7P7_NEUCR|nr:hypothetical protein NCU03640 [Neurospora crassa OR74A]EAA32131.3 hypothetical protein NCU03640 [Neurospora crassa OR74A]CAD11397.1 hypothetical protein [Neurospora crassa]|eukprot:XP_961367.3 hypothetical protein NCU03640 [Neurospora crassa OR74A]